LAITTGAPNSTVIGAFSGTSFTPCSGPKRATLTYGAVANAIDSGCSLARPSKLRTLAPTVSRYFAP